MKKKLLLLALLPFALVGCGGDVEPFSYVNPSEEQHEIGPELEEGILLDGKGNDSFYNNDYIYKFDNVDGEDARCEVKFGFAEKGLLIHAYVFEKKIFENPNIAIFEQSSVEFYINPTPYKDELRSKCVQFRLSPNKRTESWIGLKSKVDDYPWSRYYVPFRYETCIDGKVITNESDQYDESFFNSAGVGYELYVPYTSLGLTYNPEGIDVLPAMVTAHSVFADDRVWSSYRGVGTHDLANYIRVGNRKYKDQGDNIFDDDRSSSGFILDHQLDSDYPYITNFGIHDQYCYFNTFGNMYHASATVNLFGPLENDLYPKVGIGSINEHGTSVMLLDPRPSKNCFEALLVHRTAGKDWEWGAYPPSWKGEKTYEKPIKLDIVRIEETMFYYMNGLKVFSSNTLKLHDENSYPILMTMNYTARFDNFSLTTNEIEIMDFVGELDPYLDASSSSGYEYSNDVYTQTGIGEQYGIMKEKSTSYTFSVDVKVGEVLNNDNFPKIGIGEITDDKQIQAYLLDPRPGFNNFEAVHAIKSEKFDWNWSETFWAGENDYDRFINLKIERDGDVSKFYMDNQLVFTLSNNSFGSKATHPMFLTMNQAGTFKNINFETK